MSGGSEHSAENEAVSKDVLDLFGRWEIRTVIYRNGRRVGNVDTDDWGTFGEAAYWIGEALSTREVDMHNPKRRRLTRPGTTTGGA